MSSRCVLRKDTFNAIFHLWAKQCTLCGGPYKIHANRTGMTDTERTTSGSKVNCSTLTFHAIYMTNIKLLLRGDKLPFLLKYW